MQEQSDGRDRGADQHPNLKTDHGSWRGLSPDPTAIAFFSGNEIDAIAAQLPNLASNCVKEAQPSPCNGSKTRAEPWEMPQSPAGVAASGQGR
jgi:hypothetical protein